jgi:hypothetical protein
MDQRVRDSRQGLAERRGILTPEELASLALTVHTGSFVLSLTAVYAVFGDKFVVPSLERAHKVCAKLRGKLSSELQQELAPLVGPESTATTANVIYGADDQPAKFIHPDPLSGEKFTEAFRRFLDSQSDDFCRYHAAMQMRHRMWRCWSNTRILSALWPLSSLVGVVVFGAFKTSIVSTPSHAWLWTIAAFLILPLVLLLAHLPALAFATKRLESLEA